MILVGAFGCLYRIIEEFGLLLRELKHEVLYSKNKNPGLQGPSYLYEKLLLYFLTISGDLQLVSFFQRNVHCTNIAQNLKKNILKYSAKTSISCHKHYY